MYKCECFETKCAQDRQSEINEFLRNKKPFTIISMPESSSLDIDGNIWTMTTIIYDSDGSR